MRSQTGWQTVTQFLCLFGAEAARENLARCFQILPKIHA
jgi:hypothetical protein